MMTLFAAQKNTLLAMAKGDILKSHRYLNGAKVYRLHALDGRSQTVRRAAIAALQDRGLIDNNKKFPAATYWLTDTGRQLIAKLHANPRPQ